MFTFNVFGHGKFQLSIEQPTHLLLLEQVIKGEDYPRYIRMTGQQVEKMRNILFGGNFSSTTIPRNDYVLDGTTIHIKCHEDNQYIDFPFEAFESLDKYYTKHKQRIVRYDARFNNNRY